MPRSLAYAVALAVSALVACSSEKSEDSKAAATGEPVLIQGAVRDGKAWAVDVHADTGVVTAHGPALPIEAPVDGFGVDAWSLPDGRVVASATAPIGTDSLAWIGDGQSWNEIARDKCPMIVKPSPAKTMAVVTFNVCGPEIYNRPAEKLVGLNGEVIATNDPMTAEFAPSLVVAPDDSYVLLARNRQLAIRSIATRTEILLPAEYQFINAPKSPTILFPTSLVVRGSENKTAWLDTSGQPIEVAGFAGDALSASEIEPGKFVQVANGKLSLFADRGIAYEQPIANYALDDIQSVVPNRYVVARSKDSMKLALVGPNGAQLNEAQTETQSAEDGVTVVASTSSWLIAQSSHLPPADFMGPVDSRVFLILPSETTAPSKGTLLFSGRNTADRPFFASPSGNYALYSFDGELHAVDVQTQTDLRMDASYRYTLRK